MYRLNSNTFKGVFLLGYPTCPEDDWNQTQASVSHRAREPEGDFSSSQSSQPLDSKVFKSCLIFLILPGWVNFSHRNWFPPEILMPFAPSGQNRVTTSFLRFDKFSLFLQNRKYTNSGKISREHFLFYDYYLPKWAHFNLPFCLTTNSRKRIVLKHQQWSGELHQEEESLILSPWHWVLIVQPCTVAATIFFFLRFKKQELQNCL